MLVTSALSSLARSCSWRSTEEANIRKDLCHSFCCFDNEHRPEAPSEHRRELLRLETILTGIIRQVVGIFSSDVLLDFNDSLADLAECGDPKVFPFWGWKMSAYIWLRSS